MQSIKTRPQKCHTNDNVLIDDDGDSKRTRKDRKKHHSNELIDNDNDSKRNRKHRKKHHSNVLIDDDNDSKRTRKHQKKHHSNVLIDDDNDSKRTTKHQKKHHSNVLIDDDNDSKRTTKHQKKHHSNVLIDDDNDSKRTTKHQKKHHSNVLIDDDNDSKRTTKHQKKHHSNVLIDDDNDSKRTTKHQKKHHSNVLIDDDNDSKRTTKHQKKHHSNVLIDDDNDSKRTTIHQKKHHSNVLINDDNDSKRTTKHQKHHSKRKVKAKVEPFQNLETLVITQKVEVKKQKFKCIINVTNICKQKQKHTKNEDRIIPRCLRNHKGQRTKQSKKSESSKNKKCRIKTSPDWGSLSPMSISSSDSKLCYEDISSESLQSYDDDDIDYLIKRTKERERKLSQSFDGVPFNCSTPKYLESISDGESILGRISDMDASLHSTATLVLEQQPGLYSPSSPTSPTTPNRNKEENAAAADYKDSDKNLIAKAKDNNVQTEKRKYSPVVDVTTSLENPGGFQFQHICHIKNEPYSPSESPICCHGPEINPYEVQIKLEKTELVPTKDTQPDKLKIKLEENYEVIDVKPIIYSPYN